MAEDNKAAAKKIIDENKARIDEAEKKHADTIGKSHPTPTQEENDLAALGASVEHKEDDGSGPDPHLATRQAEARPGSGAGSYQTRASSPTPPRTTRSTAE